MLTNNFKITLITLGAVAVAGGLTVNQIALTQKMHNLEQKSSEVMVVTASPTPTATPSATPVVPKLPLGKVTLPAVSVTKAVK